MLRGHVDLQASTVDLNRAAIITSTVSHSFESHFFGVQLTAATLGAEWQMLCHTERMGSLLGSTQTQ